MGVYLAVADTEIELADCVLETTQTQGTGAYSLDGVSTQGRRSFVSGVGSGAKTIYKCELGDTYEIGVGTITDGAPDTLSRDFILETSADPNPGASPINWPTTAVKSIYGVAAADLLEQIRGPGRELWCGTAGGTANSITLTAAEAGNSYANGLTIRFVVADDNTADDPVVNLNEIGDIVLEQAVGVGVEKQQLQPGSLIVATYVSTTPGFVVQSGLTIETPLPRGYIDGCILSQAADADHDLTIAAGAARSDDNTKNLVLASAITKRFDATWAVGSTNGGMQSGSSLPTSSWVEVYLIKRLDTGVVDVIGVPLADTLSLPANYDLSRRIGSFLTDSSANFRPFTHHGDQVWFTTPVHDVNENVSTTAESKTLSAPPNSWAVINFHVNNGEEAAGIYISPTFVTDQAPSSTASPLSSLWDEHSLSANLVDQVDAAGTMTIRVNSSSQARLRCMNSTNVDLVTLGYIDPRGKDA